jgi:hypothetical protein
MLEGLHADALATGDRARFPECVGALRERRLDVFKESAHYYVSWCLRDALAKGRHEVVPSLAQELAASAGREIDIFNLAAEALGSHGELKVLLEALRVAWPLVKSSDGVVPWGISRFAERSVSHEIYDYLEHADSPDPDDAGLLERVQFFIKEPREGFLGDFLGDLTGNSRREWHADDFGLSQTRKRRRRDGDGESEDPQTPAPGKLNLARLINTFVGYLRREEGAPFSRGELVRRELYSYFSRRNEGDLDPLPSRMGLALDPKRKLPKPPEPTHPLCPERVTLEVHLAGLIDERHYSAAALLQAMPAWLRFLESQRLIDAATCRNSAAELLPLHDTLLGIWEKHTEDPLLYRHAQAWQALP